MSQRIKIPQSAPASVRWRLRPDGGSTAGTVGGAAVGGIIGHEIKK